MSESKRRARYTLDSSWRRCAWSKVGKRRSPLPGSAHAYKYRLAYVVNGVCVLRYDNESGKGDHRHFRDKESRYAFDDVDKLLASFQRDIERLNREDSDA